MTSLSAKARNNVTITGNLNAAATIVLGEGFGTDQSAFQQIIPAFEKDYKILLYDNVGGGHSDLSGSIGVGRAFLHLRAARAASGNLA